MKVTILAGIPGSGKTTWALEQEDVWTFSADKWFDTPDGYVFVPEELGKAHRWCLRQFIAFCEKYTGVSYPVHLVVDNTNTTLDQIAPYIAIAQAFTDDVNVKVFDAAVGDGIRRNVHNVPVGTVVRMKRSLTNMLESWPSRWPKPEVVKT